MSLNIENATQCNDLISLINQILKLSTDYKYLEAKVLYNRLLGKLQWNSEQEEKQHQLKNRNQSDQHEWSKTITDLLDKHKNTFETILSRVDEVEYTLNNLSLDQSLATANNEVDDQANVNVTSSRGDVNKKPMTKTNQQGNNNIDTDTTGPKKKLKWIFGASYLGVTTHYVVRPDGLLTLHVEGVVDNLPFFEQLCVLNEVGMFKEWVPFCHSSEQLRRIGHAELLAHFHISLGLFSRDCAVRCYGADCLRQHDCIIIIGASIPTPQCHETATFPPYQLESGEMVDVPWTSSATAAARTSAAPSMFPSFLSALGGGLASLGSHSHMEMKNIQAVFKVLSPDSAKATLLYTIDPRANIPQFILNFAIKNLAGILLYLLQSQAEKVRTDGHCKHAQRMREDEVFYQNWLLPKFRDYCAFRGWPQPTIAALREAGLAPTHWAAPLPVVDADSDNDSTHSDGVGVSGSSSSSSSGSSGDEDGCSKSEIDSTSISTATTSATVEDEDEDRHRHCRASSSNSNSGSGASAATAATAIAAVSIVSAVESLLDIDTPSPPATQTTTTTTTTTSAGAGGAAVTVVSTVESLLDISTPEAPQY